MSTFRIPQGRYEITSRMDDRVRALARAKPRVGQIAFPIFALVGALGGMGLRIKDLAEALGLDFMSGPVLARNRLSFAAPLLVDRVYAVDAEVDALLRKPSRTYGTADHLHLAIKLSTETLHSTARFHIVFPGRQG